MLVTHVTVLPGRGPPAYCWPVAEHAAETGPRRPTAAEVAAATGLTIPDVIAPGLRVLFSGINPGLYSAATGYHFARPGNRFWPALHQSGFTPRQLRPDEQEQLLGLGLGITNVVSRATARADELTGEELREGGIKLLEKAESFGPRWLAIVASPPTGRLSGRPAPPLGRRPGPRAPPDCGCCRTQAASTRT